MTASIFGAMSASHDLQRQLKRLELCLPGLRRGRQSALGEFTRSSTTASASSPSAMPRGVILHTRRCYDFADRFPLAAAAVAKLPVKSCVTVGEA